MKRDLIYVILVSALLGGCSHNELSEMETNIKANSLSQAISLPNGAAKPGIVYVKLQGSIQSELRKTYKSGNITLNSMPTAIATTLNSIKASQMERLFLADPRFEKRKIREGLDRWYIVNFDKEQNLEQTVATLKSNSAFEIVEKVYAAKLPEKPASINTLLPVLSQSTDPMPFNDPQLNRQWHYRNFGITERSVAGADINLFEAWRTNTGSSNVIVSIVDGGIDVTHEDLISNLWVNSDEIPGNAIDDDRNGFVDDVNGYNFVSNKGEITLDKFGHGTHVAGTVAARNNNGIGVGGVAGGNGSPNSGIRLMSCQMFEEANSASGERVTVYGADNGAVISQNSWGYSYPGPGEMPASMRAAIDYFIKYAGCDTDGNQLPDSPMKGGVVIYAAGNDNMDYKSYPSAYPPVIAVSAMAPNWKKTYYTNRGDWVDIMAPGGDQYFANGMVLSTVPASIYQGNKYGYMEGTSMACPHVSGIAALIVSQYGRQGFTNKDLEVRLLGSLRPENINTQNPQYAGRLGIGYIDAAGVFAVNRNQRPANITDLNANADFTSLTLSWSAVADADDEIAIKYLIYVSNRPLTTSNYKNITPFTLSSTGIRPGQTLTYKVPDLEINTPYYVAVIAVDRWGLESDFVANEFRTRRNDPPVISGLPTSPIRVTGADVQTFTVTTSDPNGQALTYKLGGENRGVSVVYQNGILNFSLRAVAPVGSYEIELTITDALGGATTAKIPFEVVAYKPPVLSKSLQSMILGIDQGATTIDLNQYFTYLPTSTLSVVAQSSDNSVATVTVNGAALSVKGNKPGKATVRVTLSDGKESAQTEFPVHVVASSSDLVYQISPIPATRTLNVLVNPAIKQADFTIRSVAGEKVFSQRVTISVPAPVQLNIQSLSAGVYSLIMESSMGSYKKTFVKQ